MTQDLYNSFKPMLTPKQMLIKGIFGGTYFNQLVDYRKFPKNWFSEIDKSYYLSIDYNRKLNFFNIKSGQSQEEWEAKGWIHKDDPRGWFEWYCKYYEGRRHEDDERQIKRWLAFCGPKGRFQQSLLHWSYIVNNEHYELWKLERQK